MNQSSSRLSRQLFDRLYTTSSLKQVLEALEALNQNKTFKTHAQNIVTDPHLTDGQKVTQLLYLLRSIDHPVLYDFFSDILGQDQLWLFHSDKIDYFNRFVQEFQTVADDCPILYLVTSIELTEPDLVKIIQILKTGLGFRVLLNCQINPALIGGSQIKLENYLFDISVRNKLQQFQSQWLQSLDSTNTQVGHQLPL